MNTYTGTRHSLNANNSIENENEKEKRASAYVNNN